MRLQSAIKISHRQLGPLRGNSALFGTFERQGWHTTELVYDPDQPDDKLKLTATAFNQHVSQSWS